MLRHQSVPAHGETALGKPTRPPATHKVRQGQGKWICWLPCSFLPGCPPPHPENWETGKTIFFCFLCSPVAPGAHWGAPHGKPPPPPLHGAAPAWANCRTVGCTACSPMFGCPMWQATNTGPVDICVWAPPNWPCWPHAVLIVFNWGAQVN